MNQILFTENNYNKKHRPDKQKKSGDSGLLDMRKIIIIFSVIIILFAIIIISTQAIVMIKEKDKKKETPINVLNKPTITIEQIDNTCKIQIVYDEGLDKTKYWWNDDDDYVVENNMNGSTQSTRTIQIPNGDNNILHVIATGLSFWR